MSGIFSGYNVIILIVIFVVLLSVRLAAHEGVAHMIYKHFKKPEEKEQVKQQ